MLAAIPAMFSIVLAAPHDFVPDFVFTGSSLTNLQRLGRADWRAENGEIVATPQNGDGWLLLSKGYQDLEFSTDFRCTGPCEAGILFRAEKTSDGGLKGVYVSLKAGDGGSYDVALSSEGKILSRTRLGKVKVEFARIATGRWTNGQAHAPGFSKPAQTLAEQEAEAAAVPKQSGTQAAGAAPTRNLFPSPEVVPDDWN